MPLSVFKNDFLAAAGIESQFRPGCRPESTNPPRLPRRPAPGFTLIELMVVIAIIVMAAGLMTPTITDFFKNRQLEGIRGHFGSAFNKARLAAVNQGKPVSLVFFREGVRVYDETTHTFDADDLFDPDLAPFASDKVWYVLGFLNKRPSLALPSYKKWEKAQKEAQAAAAESAASSSDTTGAAARRRKQLQQAGPVFNVNGIPKVTFQRDGGVVFANGGDDVPTTEYNAKLVPDNADLIIYQAGSSTACFVDLRLTGQIRSKVEVMSEAAQRPAVSGDDSGEGQFDIDYSSNKAPESPPETDGEEKGDGQ